MTTIFAALIPVFLIIVLGWLIKQRGLFDDGFWETAERLTFYILFPSLLIVKIGGAEISGADAAPLFGVLFTLSAGVALFVMALRPRLSMEGPAFTAMLQGMIRCNTYVGLAAGFALYGEAGLTLTAVAVLAVIPLVNAIAVFAHLRWTGDEQTDRSARAIVKATSRNPIVVACLIGALLNLSGAGLPALVGESLDILGRAALPLGLLAVGAGLNLKALRISGGPVAAAVAIKLAIMPFLAVIVCGLFGVSGIALSVTVLFAALPVSTSSYVMSRQMGGDGEMMSAIIALSTLAALFTMPLAIWSLTP